MTDRIDIPDDATRPVAPDVGPVTDAQREAGAHLRAIHDHHRRTLVLIGELLERAETGNLAPGEAAAAVADSPAMRNLQRFGNLCGQECQYIHVHHSIEDQMMFPALRARAPDFASVLDRLEAEHKVVHALLVRTVEAVERLIVGGDVTALPRAADSFRTLERLLMSHFAYEEESLGDALGVHGVVI